MGHGGGDTGPPARDQDLMGAGLGLRALPLPSGLGSSEIHPGEASHFTLGERFGLVVSTFDILNHLENESALLWLRIV